MARRRILSRKALILRRYFTIIIGSFLMALAVNFIYEPMHLVTGGVSGLAIVIKKLTEPVISGGLPIWLFTIMCNVPLFLIALKLQGFKFLSYVLTGTVAYIFALYIIPIHDFQFGDELLASVIGGAVTGVGMGMVFSASASTGGTDLLATLVHGFRKHISIPQILIFIDSTVILSGAITFGIGDTLYAIIAVYVTAKVSDGYLEGLTFAKMAYVISDDYAQIAEEILTVLDRGVTGLDATGMYSQKDKKMLFCVVSKKEIVKIIEISKRIDPNSFVIVSDVREVMGEGFIEYRQ